MLLPNISDAGVLAHGNIQPDGLRIEILEIIKIQTSRGADLVPDSLPRKTSPRPNDVFIASLQIWDRAHSDINLWLVIEGRS